jgi:hypothetical protein
MTRPELRDGERLSDYVLRMADYLEHRLDAVEAKRAASPAEFMECDTCRAKPGSPTLCHGCLHNRDVISQYRRASLTRSFLDANVDRPSAPRWTAEPPSLAGYYWFYWGSCKAETAWMVELQDTGKWHSTYFDPGYSTEYLTQMNGRWWPVKIDPPMEDSE